MKNFLRKTRAVTLMGATLFGSFAFVAESSDELMELTNYTMWVPENGTEALGIGIAIGYEIDGEAYTVSDDSDIATATVDDRNVTITGFKDGETTITVHADVVRKDDETEFRIHQSREVEVTVGYPKN